MTQGLLDGLRVLDLGGDTSARAARVLGDLGADVVRAVPPAPERGLRIAPGLCLQGICFHGALDRQGGWAWLIGRA